jgi:hypothetical protein
MKDNVVQDPATAPDADEEPAVEPGKIFEDAMHRLESITHEWTEVVQSVKR